MFDDSVVRGIVLYSFTAIIFVSLLLSLMLRGRERDFQKIIGGLAVFIVAIISDNAWVFFASLFIGGLIIASEEFMKSLAAILRTSSDKVAQTLDALKVKDATPQEVEEKITAETQEVLMASGQEAKDTKGKIAERAKKTQSIQSLVNEYLHDKYGSLYMKDVKIVTKNGYYIADGMVASGKNLIRERSIIIETKYVSTSDGIEAIKHVARRLVEKLKKLDIYEKIVIVVVSEKMTAAAAVKMLQDVKDVADVIAFKLENNHLDLVLDPT